jgi:signal transduction histidine kinase
MDDNDEVDLLRCAREEIERASAELASMGARLEIAEAQLDRQDCLLDSVLATVHDVVIVTDRNLRVEGMSDSAQLASGWRADEASGKPLRAVAERLGLRELPDSVRHAMDADCERDQLRAAGWMVEINVTDDCEAVVIVGQPPEVRSQISTVTRS